MFLWHNRFCASLLTVALVGCTSGAELMTPKVSLNSDRIVLAEEGAPNSAPLQSQTVIETSGTEYFSESQYGVKASPRVAGVTALAMNASFNERGSTLISYAGRKGLAPPPTKLKRGGGRAQIGKPYTIRGKRFVPRKQPNLNRTGYASWYGSAFHGRLTANGEVYDMNHLTAAHPTLPLPSYVRVTNASNGRSVIVRVNDRGPFAKNRIIDLSRRAAIALGTTKAGVAKVNVKYVGPAPLHGQDDDYLLASYRAPGIATGGDEIIALLPAKIPSHKNPVAIIRPASPLSFAPMAAIEMASPYKSTPPVIFISSEKGVEIMPETTTWLSTFGRIDQKPDGIHLELRTLGQANKTLRTLWQKGFKQAMFVR